MSHFIVDRTNRVCQRVNPDADVPTDPRFVKVEADTAHDAIETACNSITISRDLLQALIDYAESATLEDDPLPDFVIEAQLLLNKKGG